MTKSALFALAPAASALAVAGCASGASGYAQAAPSRTAGKAAPTVALATSKFGKILVGSDGRTLYLFAADKMMASTCYGACASVWPPLAVIGTPKAGPGVQASLLGTTKRTNGSAEVTYNGHPLYHYAGDTTPGATNGQNIDEVGALWHVLSANGNEVGHG
jgi:predicted lipoprotein with Yx(FWY)xxD motif